MKHIVAMKHEVCACMRALLWLFIQGAVRAYAAQWWPILTAWLLVARMYLDRMPVQWAASCTL